MNDSNKTDPTLARAVLPEILFADDLALALKIDEERAAADLAAGLLGPTIMVHGRMAVLRPHFLETLSLHAASRRRLRPMTEGVKP